jgi:hypothetical protein
MATSSRIIASCPAVHLIQIRNINCDCQIIDITYRGNLPAGMYILLANPIKADPSNMRGSKASSVRVSSLQLHTLRTNSTPRRRS